MNTNLMFSSATCEWETPQDFFDTLNQEFHFTLDPCATIKNAKCQRYYTVAENGLAQDWKGETVFCNPPYGRELKQWIAKCALESQKPNTTVVMLIPARTDTQAFHKYIIGKAEIRFIRGRLKFANADKPVSSAPFPSMVVIMGAKQKMEESICFNVSNH